MQHLKVLAVNFLLTIVKESLAKIQWLGNGRDDAPNNSFSAMLPPAGHTVDYR